MMPMSKINKAEVENKQRTHFWLLPFLLAIALGWVNISPAAAQSSACNAFINFSTQLDHCCRIESPDTGRFRSGSENQAPCTCRSQYDEKMRTAVSPDSLRNHFRDATSVLQQNTQSIHMQIAKRIIGRFPLNPIPIFLITARLLI